MAVAVKGSARDPSNDEKTLPLEDNAGEDKSTREDTAQNLHTDECV